MRREFLGEEGFVILGPKERTDFESNGAFS